MAKPEREKVLETILALAGVAVLVHLLARPDTNVLLWLSLGLVFTGLLFKSVATRLTIGWEYVTSKIGGVVSKLVLGLVWLLVLVPVALISRLFRKRKMITPPQSDSYYIARNHTYTADDLKYPW